MCRHYRPCGFLGFVWTDCWGDKSNYVITSPANCQCKNMTTCIPLSTQNTFSNNMKWYVLFFLCFIVNLVNINMKYLNVMRIFLWVFITFVSSVVFSISKQIWKTLLKYSSVAKPICQEGQSERTFPIFPLFPLFFLIFSLFFPIFDKFFAVKGAPSWIRFFPNRGFLNIFWSELVFRFFFSPFEYQSSQLYHS